MRVKCAAAKGWRKEKMRLTFTSAMEELRQLWIRARAMVRLRPAASTMRRI